MSHGVADAASNGSRREALEAIRDKLATELESAEGKDAAPIAKELRAALQELDSLTDGGEASAVDDLTSRRQARRAEATGS